MNNLTPLFIAPKEVYKWGGAHFSGNQCLLMMKLDRHPIPYVLVQDSTRHAFRVLF